MVIDMAELTELLPNSVIKDIIDFTDIELKDGRVLSDNMRGAEFNEA